MHYLLPHHVASLRCHLAALLPRCLFRITSLPLSHYLIASSSLPCHLVMLPCSFTLLPNHATFSPCCLFTFHRVILLLHVLPLYLISLPCCHCVLPSCTTSLPRGTFWPPRPPFVVSLPRASLPCCLAASLSCWLVFLPPFSFVRKSLELGEAN
jgi:hypothetical protein